MRLYNHAFYAGVDLHARNDLTLEILAEGWRRSVRVPGAGPPPWLAQVHEVLHHGFIEPLPLGALAAQAGVHPVHVAAALARLH
jgi:hypothetical protein